MITLSQMDLVEKLGDVGDEDQVSPICLVRDLFWTFVNGQGYKPSILQIPVQIHNGIYGDSDGEPDLEHYGLITAFNQEFFDSVEGERILDIRGELASHYPNEVIFPVETNGFSDCDSPMGIVTSHISECLSRHRVRNSFENNERRLLGRLVVPYEGDKGLWSP